MKSELSFLLELLLHHDLPKPTKDLLATRIEEVEARIGSGSHGYVAPQTNAVFGHTTTQAPSTLALMAKHGIQQAPAPEPVVNVAQTPATAAAMSARQDMISKAIAGKPPMKNRQFK